MTLSKWKLSLQQPIIIIMHVFTSYTVLQKTIKNKNYKKKGTTLAQTSITMRLHTIIREAPMSQGTKSMGIRYT